MRLGHKAAHLSTGVVSRDMADEESGRLERAINGGTDLASKFMGAGMGLLGPEAALLGPGVEWISGQLLSKVGTTVVRMVGQGAAERAGAALLVIRSDAEEHARNGETPRSDGFAESRDGHRPDSEELLEGVLLHAAESYEQRKVVPLAHLYDGLAFDSRVSADEGHFLVKLADRLTYRQLVGLSVLQSAQYFDTLVSASYRRDQGEVSPSDAIALEIDDLADQGVIGVQVAGGDEIARPGELWGSSGRASAKPFQDLKLTSVGLVMHRLMRLSSLSAEDQAAFLNDLAIPVHQAAR
jgi:hypothetical protein